MRRQLRTWLRGVVHTRPAIGGTERHAAAGLGWLRVLEAATVVAVTVADVARLGLPMGLMMQLLLELLLREMMPVLLLVLILVLP
jgi:hypothetical protein